MSLTGGLPGCGGTGLDLPGVRLACAAWGSVEEVRGLGAGLSGSCAGRLRHLPGAGRKDLPDDGSVPGKPADSREAFPDAEIIERLREDGE